MPSENLPQRSATSTPAKRESSIDSLLSLAIDRNVAVETLQSLLNMQLQIRAEEAKQAYNEAMTAFQADVPVIVDIKPVYDKYGNLRRKYSPIDYLVTQLRPYLQKYGFHFKFDTSMFEDTVTVTCTAIHSLGHAESASITLRKIERSQMMNDTQADAGSYTMAQRYALKAVFGIVTGGTDSDGMKVETKPTKDELDKLIRLLELCRIPIERILKQYKLFMLEDMEKDLYEKLIDYCEAMLPQPTSEE